MQPSEVEAKWLQHYMILALSARVQHLYVAQSYVMRVGMESISECVNTVALKTLDYRVLLWREFLHTIE